MNKSIEVELDLLLCSAVTENLKAAVRDAQRYRFLRHLDNTASAGYASCCLISETVGDEFDRVVDKLMAKADRNPIIGVDR